MSAECGGVGTEGARGDLPDEALGDRVETGFGVFAVSGSSWANSTDAAGTACAYDTVELVVWSGTGNSRRVGAGGGGTLMPPLTLAYLLVGRLVLAKAFFADERCTSCGACQAACPHGAIRLLGRGRRPY